METSPLFFDLLDFIAFQPPYRSRFPSSNRLENKLQFGCNDDYTPNVSMLSRLKLSMQSIFCSTQMLTIIKKITNLIII